MQTPRLEPAVIVWAGLVGAALVADLVLIRRGHRSLSEVSRHPIGDATRRYLNAHLQDELPVDLFKVAARLATRRSP